MRNIGCDISCRLDPAGESQQVLVTEVPGLDNGLFPETHEGLHFVSAAENTHSHICHRNTLYLSIFRFSGTHNTHYRCSA